MTVQIGTKIDAQVLNSTEKPKTLKSMEKHAEIYAISVFRK